MSARQVVITQIHDGAALMVSPLPKDLPAADVLDLLREAFDAVTDESITHCECTLCYCPITLAPAESGVCADCQGGDHHTTGETL